VEDGTTEEAEEVLTLRMNEVECQDSTLSFSSPPRKPKDSKHTGKVPKLGHLDAT
jgi:hypothetical protein